MTGRRQVGALGFPLPPDPDEVLLPKSLKLAGSVVGDLNTRSRRLPLRRPHSAYCGCACTQGNSSYDRERRRPCSSPEGPGCPAQNSRCNVHHGLSTRLSPPLTNAMFIAHGEKKQTRVYDCKRFNVTGCIMACDVELRLAMI